MKSAYLMFVLATALPACTTYVYGESDDPAQGAHPAPGETPNPGQQGTPCAYLYGQVTLTDYVAYDNYASSAFSFEFATQDAGLTQNEFDLLYDGDMFRVNTITDDRSFIVDLGDVALEDAPEMVDPDEYPLGAWNEHDNLQAYLDHTYFVRSVDGAGSGVSAFTVIGLRPGVDVTIEWIHSVDPDALVIPTHCM